MISPAQAEEARAYRFPERSIAYTTRDAILYNLGIGCSEGRYCYEKSPNFGPFPTIPLVLALKGTSVDIIPFGTQGLFIPPSLSGVPMTRILHGEQYVEFIEPLPPHASEGKLLMRGHIASLDDKGKGSVLNTVSEVVDVSGKVYVRLVSGVFLKGIGGFGGPSGQKTPSITIPSREPDMATVEKTLDIQAKLYRLSGDYNPLHIDQDVAGALGFDRPISHGLCNFAIAARCIVKEACGGNPLRLKWMRGRLVAPAYPGDELRVDIWREGTNGACARVAAGAKGNVVILIVQAGVEPAASKDVTQRASSKL